MSIIFNLFSFISNAAIFIRRDFCDLSTVTHCPPSFTNKSLEYHCNRIELIYSDKFLCLVVQSRTRSHRSTCKWECMTRWCWKSQYRERALGMDVRVYIYSSVQDACRSCVSVSVYKLLYYFFSSFHLLLHTKIHSRLSVLRCARARIQAASGFSNVMERRKKNMCECERDCGAGLCDSSQNYALFNMTLSVLSRWMSIIMNCIRSDFCFPSS